MTPRERTARALLHEPVDRLPVQVNYTGRTGRRLAEHFGVALHELPGRLGNHLLRLDLGHRARLSADGRVAYDWWGAGWGTEAEGYWHAEAPMRERVNLAAFPWPDPNDPALLEDAAAQLAADGGEHFAVPNFGFALFERAWSLRGFDAFLLDLVDDAVWAEELLERIAEIQLVLARRFLALGQGNEGDAAGTGVRSPRGIDGAYFGDDYGAQRSLLMSPRLWRGFIKPRLAKLFAVFREAGLPVIFHSDGDIWPILPDLVEMGVSCLNPVQPEVLPFERLQREFGRHLAFYGGISTQGVLPAGSPAEVRAATLACQQWLAPHGTGLLLGPSHRMQSDIPLENVLAMLEAFSPAP